MSVPRPLFARASRRAGFMLLELVICLVAGSLLMAGLATSIFLASRTFDGHEEAAQRASASQAQAEMLADLRHATSFVERSASAAEFHVPDRDSDGDEEVIRYAWTGLPTAQVTYSLNGAPPAVLLDNVQEFQFTYGNRFIAGQSPLPPPFDPSTWGNRWVKENSILGFDTIFPNTEHGAAKIWGTIVTMPEDGTVISISGYVGVIPGENTDVSFAIYSTNHNNNPQSLLVSTTSFKAQKSGWVTLPAPATTLVGGEVYLLCMSYNKTGGSHRYVADGGRTFFGNHDALKKGWPSTFSSQGSNLSSISIYATYEPR